MIITPKTLLEMIHDGKIIKNLSNRELNSPEGVGFDLCLDKIAILEAGSGSLKIDTRRTPKVKNINPDTTNCFQLKPNKSYLATTIEEFELPNELAAVFYPRSTLFRSGIIFGSSVLPPGYIGPMTFTLTNNYHEKFEIEKGARFAHVVFHSVSGDVGLYKGQWQGGRISQPDDEGQI